MDPVLIVDSDALSSQVLTDALSVLGYKPLLAVDVHQALRKLSKHPETRLALLGTDLPHVTAYESYHQLADAAPKLTFIIIAGASPSTLEKLLYEDNVMGSIHEPFNIRQLASTIESILRPDDAEGHDSGIRQVPPALIRKGTEDV